MVEQLKVEIALDGSEEIQSQMRVLGESIRETFSGISAAAAKLSVALGAIGVALGALATTKLIAFAQAAEETEKALTQLQKVSGQSFENLSALATVFAEGGTDIKKFAAEFGNLSEKIADAGQQAAIRRADKDVVQWANDVVTVRKKFDDLNVGALSTLITLDTKVKALQESLSRVPAADQWFRLADIFKNLGSDLERAQIGKKLGLSPETIATLTRGGEEMRRLQAQAQQLGLTLTTSNQQALQQMEQQWNQFTGILSAIFQKIGALAAPAFAQLLQISSATVQGIVSDFQNMPIEQAIANIGPRLVTAFSAIAELLSPIATAIGNAFLESLKAALTPTTSLWDAILNDFAKFGASLVANAGILGEKIRRALGSGGGGGGDSGIPMASGGVVGGRGTGTSDSNLAWLSRGEYVMTARATRQPGVLALLEALRRSGGNLSRVLDGMGRFAMGGMVAPRMIPAFASGGLNGGGSRVLNLTIEGRSFAGLSVPESTAQSLEQFAVHSQIASTGRKPSWRR